MLGSLPALIIGNYIIGDYMDSAESLNCFRDNIP